MPGGSDSESGRPLKGPKKMPSSGASTPAILDEEGQTSLVGGRGYGHAIRFTVACGFSVYFRWHSSNPSAKHCESCPGGDGMVLRGLRKPLPSFWLPRWETLVFTPVKGL